MTITIELAEAIERALSGIENVSVFQGFVPESVPEYLPNHIKPYVAIFMGVGAGYEDMVGLCGTPDNDSLTVDFTITCVAQTTHELYALTDTVRDRLATKKIMGDSYANLDWAAAQGQVMLTDSEVTPARLYTPLTYTITIPRG